MEKNEETDFREALFREALEKFTAREKSTLEVLYGGDGTLVGEWRKFSTRKGAKCLLPVRNYGMCQKHKELYTKFFRGDEDAVSLKQFLFPVLRGEFKEAGTANFLDALSELTVTSADPTAALRFNIRVNGNLVVENVIANGVIFATRLGSTGYFKSVARTIFTEGIGIGFICPTYSIPNIIVKLADSVNFELARKSEVMVTADKLHQKVDADAGWRFDIQDACENIPVIGYDHFMCPECRLGRNSTMVNDSYCVV